LTWEVGQSVSIGNTPDPLPTSLILQDTGWDGTDCLDAGSGLLAAAADELKRAGIAEDLLIELNDSGMCFEEIAD
jgi:hypothetical protein